MKQQLEKAREEIKKLAEIDPSDVRLNDELSKSIQWLEYALLRIEAREEQDNDWYNGDL